MKPKSETVRPAIEVIKIDERRECDVLPEHFFTLMKEMPTIQSEMQKVLPKEPGQLMTTGQVLEMTIRLFELCERFDVNLHAIFRYNRACNEQPETETFSNP